MNLKIIKEQIKNNMIWLILVASLISFLIIAKDVINKETIALDIIGYKIISTFIISDEMTKLIKIITNFGGVIGLCTMTILLFLIIKNKKIGACICCNLAIIAGLNLLIKNILRRPRPTGYRLISESGFSFPSGHSMISMAFYGYITYLIYRYIKNKYLRLVLIMLLSILILLIGISRIYLGVHYTSDVLAGFLISICYLILFIKITNKFLKLYENEA